jgi:hypothetical protein
LAVAGGDGKIEETFSIDGACGQKLPHLFLPQLASIRYPVGLPTRLSPRQSPDFTLFRLKNGLIREEANNFEGINVSYNQQLNNGYHRLKNVMFGLFL